MTSPSALPRAHNEAILASVHSALEEGETLTSHGFLPARAPTCALPPPFRPHVSACRELPERYHREGADVRPWLHDAFAEWDPDALSCLESAPIEALDGAMTAVTTLAHAYRWGCMPPSSEAYELKDLVLPKAIGEPLRFLSSRLGVPPCGNLYHMVLANWRIAAIPEGGSYSIGDLLRSYPSALLQFSWLNAPAAGDLAATLRCVIATEAIGADILPSAVRLASAAIRRDVQETTFLLDKLRTLIDEVGGALRHYMRPQQISPQAFLSVIQPHFLWGLAHEGERLDGASGAQTPTIQLLDSTFGVPRTSELGATILSSRSLLPPSHRRLLDAMDRVGPIVRSFIASGADPDTVALWNDCLKGLLGFRRAHQRRGAMYLRAGSANYRSVSGTVAEDDGEARAIAYEAAMDEHVRETLSVIVPQEAAVTAQYAFRFLSEEDLERMLAGGKRNVYNPGEVILAQGSRRRGIFIVRRGSARVTQSVRGVVRDIVDLVEGDVFGELSFIENSGATASVTAGPGCEVDVIAPEHIYELLGTEGFASGFYHSLAVLLSQRFRAARLAQWDTSLASSGWERLPHGASYTRPAQTDIPVSSREPPPTSGESASAHAAGDALLKALSASQADPEGKINAVARLLRDAYPWLMASELCDLFFRGTVPARPISQRALERLFRGGPRGHGIQGVASDMWARALPMCRFWTAVPERLARLLAQLSKGSGPVRVTLLDVGACWFVPLPHASVTTEVTIVSAEEPLIGHDNAKGHDAAHLRADVLGVARGKWRLHLPPQDLIVADLLPAWHTDAALEEIITWAHRHLAEGGAMLFGGLSPSAPDRLFWDDLLQLSLRRRSAEELLNLFQRTELDSASIAIEESPEGAGLIVIGQKPRRASRPRSSNAYRSPR